MAVWALEQVHVPQAEHRNNQAQALFQIFVASTATPGARFADWQPTTTHNDNKVLSLLVGYDSFTKLHNDHCFGPAIIDCKLLKTDENKWKMPTSNDRQKNSRHIQEIQRVLPYGLVDVSQQWRIVEDIIKNKIVHITLHLSIFSRALYRPWGATRSTIVVVEFRSRSRRFIIIKIA
jgi:hypothetical protein